MSNGEFLSKNRVKVAGGLELKIDGLSDIRYC